jgi:hypothetical protein
LVKAAIARPKEVHPAHVRVTHGSALSPMIAMIGSGWGSPLFPFFFPESAIHVVMALIVPKSLWAMIRCR